MIENRLPLLLCLFALLFLGTYLLIEKQTLLDAQPVAASVQDLVVDTAVIQAETAVSLSNYSPQTPFTVRFSQPVDPASALLPLLVSPNGSGVFTWSENNTLLTFVPQDVQSDTVYFISINPELKGISGWPVEGMNWQVKTTLLP